MNLPGFHDPRAGDWAIAVVQERFWGLPSRGPHLVLLTNFIYWKGETYFIDGSHENGLLTRALPIVGAGISCSRPRPVQDAIIDLRVLREAPPAGGTQLIGYVRPPEVFRGGGPCRFLVSSSSETQIGDHALGPARASQRL